MADEQGRNNQMAVDQENEAPVECKENERQGCDPWNSRRVKILLGFDRCVWDNQHCCDKASPMHGAVLFGKLQLMAMESGSLLKDTLLVMNPCNYFRKEYRAQECRKASGFYGEVKCILAPNTNNALSIYPLLLNLRLFFIA